MSITVILIKKVVLEIRCSFHDLVYRSVTTGFFFVTHYMRLPALDDSYATPYIIVALKGVYTYSTVLFIVELGPVSDYL